MKAHHLIVCTFILFFILFSSLSALERTPEWYEEQGFIPETVDNGYTPAGLRTLREIPEGGLILIPDSTLKRVMAFDPQTGDLIDADFIPPYPAFLSTPIHLVLNAEGTAFLMTDQLQDTVQQFSLDGLYEGIFAPAGGVDNAILDNIRGMFVRNDGHYLVTVASGANSHAIAEFDSQGQYVGNFVANGAGGLNGPWSIIYRADFNDYLISTSGSNAIHRFDANGQSLGMFVPSINFPEQMHLMPNGNVLVATFSAPSGVYEYNSAGVQVGFYGPVTSLRGVYELPNGNILVTNGTGVYEINRAGALVDTKITGVSGRFITFVNPVGGHSIPFEEGFETGSLPEDWMQEHNDGITDWTFQNGGHNGQPSAAYEGEYNAFFRSDTDGDCTLLITPPLLIGEAINPVLRFHHAQPAWGAAQDELNVYYRTGTDEGWNFLVNYNLDVPEWTERMIELPEAGNGYYVAFEAQSGGGYGVCLDMVEVFDHIFPIIEVTPLEFNLILTEGESTSELLTVSNVGTADLEFTISFVEPADWLFIADTNGIIPPNQQMDVELIINTSDLVGGENYTANLVVSDNYFGLEINVVVNLTVEELILNPPTGLSAEIGMFFIILMWEAPVSFTRDLIGYHIYRQDNHQGDFAQINSQIVTVEEYLDADLEPGLYSYYVTALYGEGESEPSEILETLLPEQTAQPDIDPEPGVYEGEIEIALLCATPDALIYYTLDGEDPDEGSILYGEPFILDESVLLKARAYKVGYFPSEVLAAEYTINPSNIDDPGLPVPATKLIAAYPNPFNPSTTISFSLAEPGEVSLDIYNTRGQKIRTLVKDRRDAGTHNVFWNGKNDEGKLVSSGIYFYRMKAEGYVSVRKMVLIQ